MSKQEVSSLPSSKILIVDDNLQNLELLEAYMADLPGAQTLRATDGAQALEVIRQAHPDLVLLDVMMPKMSGFEVCKVMKADPATKDIPVVMVTALTEPMDIERGLESGADDYLTRPIVRQDLIERVKKALQLKRGPSTDPLDRSLAYMDETDTETNAGDEAQEE